MEKTKAQIAAEEYATKHSQCVPDHAVYRKVAEAYLAGMNAATLKWSDEDIIAARKEGYEAAERKYKSDAEQYNIIERKRDEEYREDRD